MRHYIFFVIAGLVLTSCENSYKKYYNSWTAYSGTKDGNRYSSGDEINVDNVAQLKRAWTYSTNDKDTANKSQIQTNPIVVEGVLYGASPQLKLFALNAATGEEKWIFDPAVDGKGKEKKYGISRGVVFWQNEKKTDQRILYGVDFRLYAIDAKTGLPVSSFGENGSIDLREDLDIADHENKTLYAKTPGVVYNDLLIIGTSLSEGMDALPGHIRAFDIRTGERKWIFHTIPHPGEVGYESWEDKDAWKKVGGANSWAGMSLDEEKGLVYVPTGSATPDFYGGFRKGSNLFANSIVALNAETGNYVWHYQVIHHDMWDRDLPANPNLVTINPHGGEEVDALAQITKHGYVFVLDRNTGEPVFPIVEKPVPQTALPGEEPWPTQPFPTLPEPFINRTFNPEDVSNRTPEVHAELMERYKKIKYRDPFTPPTKEGAWVFPDYDGGGGWGGAAFDVETQVLYVNANEVPSSLTMVEVSHKKQKNVSAAIKGLSLYEKHCITCHGQDLKGSGDDFPSLVDLDEKFSKVEVGQMIENGGNRMPAFEYLSAADRDELVAFLFSAKAPELASKNQKLKHAAVDPHELAPQEPNRSPYRMTGYKRFTDKEGYPGNKPPWGTLNALDLNSGKLLWKVPLGAYPELTAKNVPATGTRNYGGPVVTKGGLVFIAATLDEKIRAFDKNSGEILWEAKLPAAGYATPAVYVIDGKQYIVIACGGGKLGSKSGDSYVAFALPEEPSGGEKLAGIGIPEHTSDKWQKEREKILKGMEAAMGKLPEKTALPPFNLKVTDSLRRDTYTRLTINFLVAEDEELSAYLYVPDHKKLQKLPAMVVLHGTGDLGKQLVDGESRLKNRAQAKELAERGYVVIAPDYPSMGDSRDYNFAEDRYQSGTMKGIFNHMRCVDLLQELTYVDPARIGVLGHSLGGHNAMFVGAFDERLKVIVSSSGWTMMEDYNIGKSASKRYGGRLGPWAQDRYMPLLREKYKLDDSKFPFDFDKVISALAPRPFFSNSPVNDYNFDVGGVRQGIAIAFETYRRLGAEDNLQVRYPDAGHDFPTATRLEAYKFIDKVLEHTPNHHEIE